MANDSSMDHIESAKVHLDISGRKPRHLNKNMARLLEFVCNRDNPFIVQAPLFKLHNFVNKQLAGDKESMHLLQSLVNGDRYIKATSDLSRKGATSPSLSQNETYPDSVIHRPPIGKSLCRCVPEDSCCCSA